MRLEDFCKDWLRSRKTDLKPGSLDLYDNTVVRLTDYFGDDYLLSDITPRAAAMFISEQKPLKGEKLSSWTRNRTLRHCRTMFTTATNWDLLAKNPFSSVSAPKLPSTRWHYLKPDEYLRLLVAAPNLRCKALYALAYTAALRLGEALSLMWEDIDFENGEVRIENRPASDTLPPFSIKDYESRRIPLPKHTRDILSDLKAYNEIIDRTPYVVLDEQRYKTVLAKWKRFREQKRPWQNHDMCNNSLREFKRHVKRAEIKPNGSLSIQTLRKSCCQNWANTISNPEVVRVLTGHADLKTTMQYYCQADRD
ncbi:tyrosine-type recombinase/integrase [Planctomycetota bacterium]